MDSVCSIASKTIDAADLTPIYSPVVYPVEGPRKASVDWIDLERLDEGEFLNDNLISFYLRFVSVDQGGDALLTRKGISSIG